MRTVSTTSPGLTTAILVSSRAWKSFVSRSAVFNRNAGILHKRECKLGDSSSYRVQQKRPRGQFGHQLPHIADEFRVFRCKVYGRQYIAALQVFGAIALCRTRRRLSAGANCDNAMESSAGP